jgi:integrase
MDPNPPEPGPRPAPPRKPKGDSVRGRKHLSPTEVEATASAAAGIGRHGHRDALMVRMAFRHGLRAAEVVSLRRDQVDFERAVLHVRRVKGGTPSTHPLSGPTVRALRKTFRDYPDVPYVFVSERGGPLTERSLHHVVARAGVSAGIGMPIHPHMLRHACGHKLANEGRDTRAIQAYLGHSNIQHTVRYTELAPDRFRGFWTD